MKKKILIPLILVFILAASGAVYYYQFYLPSQGEPAPAYNTTRVRVGDIVITTSGVGNIAPTQKVTLGFQTNGVLESLNVQVGDYIEVGDILASLENEDAKQKFNEAQAYLQAFFSLKSINQAEISLFTAQTNYNKTRDNLIALIGSDGFDAVAAWVDAQLTLDQLEANPDIGEAEIVLAEEAVTIAGQILADNLPANLSDDETDSIRTQIISTEINLREAEAYLDVLQKGLADLEVEAIPSTGSDLGKLYQAVRDVEKSAMDLEETILRAPISGTVTALNGNVGQLVSNSQLITIESLDEMLLRFYVEERDISLLEVGNPIEVTFDAYPNDIVNGSITRVEPALSTFEGNSVAVVWAVLEESINFPLISGLSADVEVIAAETRDALLVPIQALREISPGSYSVFVVQPDGELRMVVVSVGLQDYANAEILTGLEQGDVISTGSIETK